VVRRAALIAWLGILLAAAPAPGWTQEAYPSKPIRMIVAFAAGSASDGAGRLLAEALGKRLGQNVIVEARPGAFGQIAAQAAARSAPDGYTLFLTTNTTHSANPHLYRTLPYDAIRDFEPVVRIGRFPFLLVVTPSLPVHTTAQLIAYAKAHPGKLSYGTPNSTSLVVMETIKRLAQVSIERVQYKSSPEAVLDLAAGRLQVMISDFATAVPQVRAGKLRALGVTTASRSQLLPTAPPIAEALPGVDTAGWLGLFVPDGTPREVVQRLARELLQVLAQPDMHARLGSVGVELAPLPPEQFGRFVQEQIDQWGNLIRAAGIEPE
jgi:tripartite-type tricarboxylate transporter receptor subunit TctC